MPIAFSCPSCESELRLRDELAGRKVKCPRCGSAIAVPGGEEPDEAEELPPQISRRRRERDREDEDSPRRRDHWEDEDDERPRRKRKKKAASNPGLLYGLIGGGVAVLVAVVVLVVILSAGGRRGMPGLAGNPFAGNVGLANEADKGRTLPEARKGFATILLRKERLGQPVPEPPPHLFRKIQFDAALGKLTACLTPDPKDNKKHPAIIWITGGDCNSIDDGIWQDAPADDDQTAAAFRQAGIIMMFPTLRGGNDNPGVREGFFGEVDDVLAAADYLGKVSYVDPQRIYLGGHSTGGTLVLLAAECSARFRAVFSFGPAHDVGFYGPEYIPFDRGNPRELELRAPARWLHGIRSPVFVIEGAVQGNALALDAIARASTNPLVHCHRVNGGNHFNILQPVTRLIAQKILRDDGASCSLTFSDEELSRLMGR